MPNLETLSDEEIEKIRELLRKKVIISEIEDKLFSDDERITLREWIAFRQFQKSAGLVAKIMIWLAGGLLTFAMTWEQLSTWFVKH